MAYSSDNFASIENVSINFSGVSGILASAQHYELYRLSVDNGLKMTYSQWRHYTGSVLCLDFAKNMGLRPNQCVSMLGTYDLSTRNISSQDIEFDLYTIVD